MKNRLWKGAALALGAALMAAAPAYAASITTVDIRVDGNSDEDFKVGAYAEDDLVDVTLGSAAEGKYFVAEYGFTEDVTGNLTTDTLPTLDIVLEAEDDYTFGLSKASQVHLSGDTKPEYVDGRVREENTELVVTVSLTSILGKAGMVEFAEWDVNRTGKLSFLSFGNTSHQIRLYKDGKEFGYIITLPPGEMEMDMSPYLLADGKFTFAVRQYNEVTHSRGYWYMNEDSVYTVTPEKAAENRANYGYISRGGLGWQHDEKGWWYKTPGGYPHNEWLKDNEHWFWFDEEGYMVTGWREIGGQWYYMRGNGERLENESAPDGRWLGEGGVLVGDPPTAEDIARAAEIEAAHNAAIAAANDAAAQAETQAAADAAAAETQAAVESQAAEGASAESAEAQAAADVAEASAEAETGAAN